jgi:type II secretory pathway pseudopilin PulG
MRDRREEQGYNLVILAVAVTVLSIMLAAALPVWSTAAKREREEELIFRGLQYAEAIRLFQQRFGRLPVRLEELVEVEPRSIRQLWEDPMTGERDWRLVRGNVPAGMDVGGGAPPGGGDDPDGRLVEDGDASAPEQGLPDGGAGLGPIRGVRSRSTDEALKLFFDKDRYDQWLFTVDLFTVGDPQRGIGPGGPVQGVRLNARWIGRPFLHGLQPGGMPAPNQPTDFGLGAPPPPGAPEDPAPPVDKE